MKKTLVLGVALIASMFMANSVVTAASKIIDFSGTMDQLNALTNKGNVVIDLHWPACKPCQNLGQNITKLAQERSDITFIKINVKNQNDSIKAYFGVKQVPHLIFYKNGKLLGGVLNYGSKTFEQFKALVAYKFQ